MHKRIKVKNTEEFFEKIKSSNSFTVKEETGFLRLRYNDIFSSIGNPDIRLTEISENEIKCNILPNTAMIILAIMVAVIFWSIMIFAVAKHKNTAAIIISGAAPIPMWGIELGFIKGISKIILGELNAINKEI